MKSAGRLLLAETTQQGGHRTQRALGWAGVSLVRGRSVGGSHRFVGLAEIEAVDCRQMRDRRRQLDRRFRTMTFPFPVRMAMTAASLVTLGDGTGGEFWQRHLLDLELEQAFDVVQARLFLGCD